MATEWTFEKAMARLEQIVAALEGGRCTLDESLGLFEEGTKLTAYCSKLLKEAEEGKQMEPVNAVENSALICDNPRCISSTEQELPHRFKLVDAERGIYRCIYCEGKKTLG